MTATQTFGFNPKQWRWPKGSPNGWGGRFMKMPWFLTADFLDKMDNIGPGGGHRNRGGKDHGLPDLKPGTGKGSGSKTHKGGKGGDLVKNLPGHQVGTNKAARDRELAHPDAPLDSMDSVRAAIDKPGGLREISADLNEKGIDSSAVDVLDKTNKARDQIASLRSRMDAGPDFEGKSQAARELDRTDAELAKVTAVPESNLETLLDDIRLKETDPGAAGIGTWDDPLPAPAKPKPAGMPAARRVADNGEPARGPSKAPRRSAGWTKPGAEGSGDKTPGGGDEATGSRGGRDADVAAAGDNIGNYLDNNELPGSTPEGVHSSLNKAADSADRMKTRDTSTDEGKAAKREDALDAQASLDDALRQLDGNDDPALADVKDSVAALHKDLTDGLGNGDTEKDWTKPGGGATTSPGAAHKPITKADLSNGGKERTRPVSAEEFNAIADRGKAKMDNLKDNLSEPSALKDEKAWSGIKDKAWESLQEEWGGETIDAHTGDLVGDKDPRYALTSRPPGMDTVDLPIGSSREDFDAAMDKARDRFSDPNNGPLWFDGAHLGVFRNEDIGKFEIDPVLLVKNHDDVEEIGAYTNAVGGAYKFDDGLGYWPPHIAEGGSGGKQEPGTVARPGKEGGAAQPGLSPPEGSGSGRAADAPSQARRVAEPAAPRRAAEPAAPRRAAEGAAPGEGAAPRRAAEAAPQRAAEETPGSTAPRRAAGPGQRVTVDKDGNTTVEDRSKSAKPPKKSGAIASKADEDDVLDFLRKAAGDDSIGRGGDGGPGGVPAFDGPGAGGGSGKKVGDWRRPASKRADTVDSGDASLATSDAHEAVNAGRALPKGVLSDADQKRFDKLKNAFNEMGVTATDTPNSQKKWLSDATDAESAAVALLDSIGRDLKGDDLDDFRHKLQNLEESLDEALSRPKAKPSAGGGGRSGGGSGGGGAPGKRVAPGPGGGTGQPGKRVAPGGSGSGGGRPTGPGSRGGQPPKPKQWRRPRRDTVLELDPEDAKNANGRAKAHRKWQADNARNITMSQDDRKRLEELDDKMKDMESRDLGTKNGREEWKKDALDAESENTALLDSIGRDDKDDGLNGLRKELKDNEKAFDDALKRKDKDPSEDEDKDRGESDAEERQRKKRKKFPSWLNNMGGGFPNGLGGGFPGLDMPHFKKKRKKAGGKKKKGRKKAKKKGKLKGGNLDLNPKPKKPQQPNAPKHEPVVAPSKYLDAIKSTQAKGGHLGDLAAGTNPLEIPGLANTLSNLSQATKSMAQHDQSSPDDMRGWHQDALAADYYANDAANLIGMVPTDDGFNPLRAALADYHGSVSGLEEWSPDDLANTLAGLPPTPMDADDPALDDLLTALDLPTFSQGLNPADVTRAQELLGTDTGPTGIAEGAALLRGMSADATDPMVARNLADAADNIGGRSSNIEVGGTRVGARDSSSNMRWTLPEQPVDAGGPDVPEGDGGRASGVELPQGVHSTGADGHVPLGNWLANNGGELGGLLKDLGVPGGVPQSYPQAAAAVGDARAALINGQGDPGELPTALGQLDALGDSLAEASWPRMPQGVHESAMMTDPILGQLGAAARDRLNVAMAPNTRLVGGPDPNSWLALGDGLDQIVPKMHELGLLDTSVDFGQGERSLWETNVQYPDSRFPMHGTAAAMADLAGMGDRPSALRAMPNAQVEGYDTMGATAPTSAMTPAILLGMGAVTTEMLDRGLYSPAQAAARVDRYESITRDIGSDAFDGVTSRLTAVAEGKPDPVSNAEVAKEWEDLTDMTEKRKKKVAPSLTAAGFPVRPPSEWFADPKLTGPTPLTVESHGRVYGHLAGFNVCHLGKAGCVTAPSSHSNYAYFRTGVVECSDGSMVNVGRITMDTGHARDNLGSNQAASHYDNTGAAAADVAAGEDQWGIWLAGAVRPHVTDAQLRTLMASPLSGDWRMVNHNLELVAALSVNTPGFPIVRTQGFVASGEVQTLIAGGFMQDDEHEHAPAKSLLDARVEARKLRLARLEKIESLGRTRELQRTAVALSARVHSV